MPAHSFEDIKKFVNLKEMTLPAGTSESAIELVEKKFSITFPIFLKQWYLFTDGAVLNNGVMSFYKLENIFDKNRGLCVSWFSLGKDLFIAESDGYKYEADFYFLKVQNNPKDNCPVFAFNADPTFTKEVSSDFYNFIEYIYGLQIKE